MAAFGYITQTSAPAFADAGALIDATANVQNTGDQSAQFRVGWVGIGFSGFQTIPPGGVATFTNKLTMSGCDDLSVDVYAQWTDGVNFFLSATHTFIVGISNAPTTLGGNIDKTTYSLQESIAVKASLRRQCDGKILSSLPVDILIDGVFATTLNTDVNGNILATLPAPKVGHHTLLLRFNGVSYVTSTVQSTILPDFQEPPQACPLVGGCPVLESVETSGGQIRATVTSTSNFATIVGITKAVDGQPAEAGQCLSGSCYIAGSKDYPAYSAPSHVGVGAQYGRGTSTKTMTRLGGNWEPIIFDKGVYYVNLYTDDGVEQLHAARKSITVL